MQSVLLQTVGVDCRYTSSCTLRF